jgi:hypothetical protein
MSGASADRYAGRAGQEHVESDGVENQGFVAVKAKAAGFLPLGEPGVLAKMARILEQPDDCVL